MIHRAFTGITLLNDTHANLTRTLAVFGGYSRVFDDSYNDLWYKLTVSNLNPISVLT